MTKPNSHVKSWSTKKHKKILTCIGWKRCVRGEAMNNVWGQSRKLDLLPWRTPQKNRDFGGVLYFFQFYSNHNDSKCKSTLNRLKFPFLKLLHACALFDARQNSKYLLKSAFLEDLIQNLTQSYKCSFNHKLVISDVKIWSVHRKIDFNIVMFARNLLCAHKVNKMESFSKLHVLMILHWFRRSRFLNSKSSPK